MSKVCVLPSTSPAQYPNGGAEDYWMSQIAAAMGPFLAALGAEPSSAPEASGLCLILRTHAAPAEVEGKIKGTHIYYYAYSPASQRAAQIVAAHMKEAYPQPELVDAAPTPVPAELSTARVPTVMIKLGYHDNPQDEAWVVNSVGKIAESLSKAAAEFLNAGEDGEP